MNIKKVVAALSAVTMLGSMTVAVPASAEADYDEGSWNYNQTVYTTSEYYAHRFDEQSGTYNNNRPSLEINTNVNDKKYSMFGAMRFRIPENPEGKVICSVNLKLITERRKAGDRTIGIYPLNTNKWSTQNLTYGDFTYTDGEEQVNDLASAIESEPVATFVPAGQNTKAIFDTGLNASNQVLSAWTNNIDIPVSAVSSGNFDIVLYLTGDRLNAQTIFFTKYAEGTREENGGSSMKINGAVTTAFTASDLHPVLTIKYSEASMTVGNKTEYYTSLDDAITAANSASSDCTIELLADAQQTVKLSPNEDVTLNGNGHTITGSGTLYQSNPISGNSSQSKEITINNATLNITGTSTTYPAFATGWKNGSKIILNNTTLNTDVVIYSTNGSTLAVKGNSTVNGTVYLYVGSYAAETSKYRTYLSLDGYTGSGVINTKLLYLDAPDGNHSNYAVGDYVANKANGKLDKINLIDNNYVLEMNPNNNGDVILKQKVISASIVKENDANYITYQTGTDGSIAAGFFAELTATVGSIQKLGVKVDDEDRGSQYLSSDGETHTTLTEGTVYIPVIVKNVTDANTITLYVE